MRAFVEGDGIYGLLGWCSESWLDGGGQVLLRRWIGDTERAGIPEPNAMALATVEAGRPVSQSVLCKGLADLGAMFVTNCDSVKGKQLAATPFASATFPWYQLGRQAHVRGPVTRADHAGTQDYWSNRLRGSQLVAWAASCSLSGPVTAPKPPPRPSSSRPVTR